MTGTAKAEGVRAVWDKYKYVLLVVAIGAGLMLWPTGRRSGEEEAAAEVRNIQKEMEAVLGKISGVGRVWVLLTEENDGERILASERKVSFRGDETSPSEYSESSGTVLVDGANGKSVVVTRTQYPTYRGALVVCEGGDRPAVRLAVTQAVMSLTGLPANRVAVEKCQ